MYGAIGTLGKIADTPGDDSETLLRHRILIFAGLLMSVGGLIWGSICFYFGLYGQAVIPFGYSLLTVLNFLFLAQTKRFGIARNIQISASLLLPFAFQWGLGGFAASGAVMLWSMLALIGSLALTRKNHAWFWLSSFAGLVVFSAFLEPRLTVAPGLGSQTASLTFFALNITVVTSVVFFLTLFFVRRREDVLQELEASQRALVQSEKMAALGQLTAGVAHEIKNPLNFINNFSETSIELLDDLRDAVVPLRAQADDDTKADIDELLEFLTSDLSSIANHGKRADSIVRNMLMHARSDSTDAAEADVNALVEEALRLAYHGERALDSEFEVQLEKDFQHDLPAVTVSEQLLTRVLINLYTNAFFAVRRKSRLSNEPFTPMVRTKTRSNKEFIEIIVRDNGTGIPEDDLPRLFEPFFTTKSVGEGSGLGLSISHNIVSEQFGGTLSVSTAPNEFAEFTIRLPVDGLARS